MNTIKKYKKLIKRIYYRLINPYPYDLNEFLSEYFKQNKKGSIIQIGANDGEMSDPIREYIKSHEGEVFLVEALPYYCNTLKKKYDLNKNITVCNLAISSENEKKDFYYIDPQIASEMNGNGPQNNWAHGQGSFSKKTIIEWINKNKFRGINYRKNISLYKSSINKINLDCINLRTLIDEKKINNIVLLLLDVQGAEYTILTGLEKLVTLPKVIIYEDDSSMNNKISTKLKELMMKLGYIFLLGENDKVWILPSFNKE